MRSLLRTLRNSDGRVHGWAFNEGGRGVTVTVYKGSRALCLRTYTVRVFVGAGWLGSHVFWMEYQHKRRVDATYN